MPQTNKKSNANNDCGNSQGIPATEALTPANPPTAILTSGKNSIVVTANHATQVQVALTNFSLVPATAVTQLDFQLYQNPPLDLGGGGADILTGTTSTFRSQPFGIFGPGPLVVQVNIDIKDDGAVVGAKICGIGAAPKK